MVVACGLQPVPEPSVGDKFAGTPLTVAEIISAKVALSSPQLLRSTIKWPKFFALAIALVMV